MSGFYARAAVSTMGCCKTRYFITRARGLVGSKLKHPRNTEAMKPTRRELP